MRDELASYRLMDLLQVFKKISRKSKNFSF